MLHVQLHDVRILITCGTEYFYLTVLYSYTTTWNRGNQTTLYIILNKNTIDVSTAMKNMLMQVGVYFLTITQ